MTTITLPRATVEQALEALEWSWGGEPMGTLERDAITALRAALAQQAEPAEPWSTRERFHEAVGRAVEAVRQEMKVKTVTMRLPEYDITLPIIDAYSGHVLVGPVVPAPPQRKPLKDEEIAELARQEQFLLVCDGLDELTEIARAIERAHGIKENTDE